MFVVERLSTVVCRRAPSNDDSATLKNCSSDSTLNGDVIRAPAGQRCDVTRRPGLSSFNPFGCRQYSTAAELQHAVPSTSSMTPVDGSVRASATSCSQPPNPPRRTTSLSCAVPPPSPPPSNVEKTSEIQKLASLAEKLAAVRRAAALPSRTLPPPRSIPPILEELNPLQFCDDSRALVVESSPSEITASHRLELTFGLSRQAVIEKALANDTNRNGRQPPPAATVGNNAESFSTFTLLTNRPVSAEHGSSVRDVSSPNSDANVDAAVNYRTSSAQASKVSELRGEERGKCFDDNAAADDGDSAPGVRSGLSDFRVSQATTPASSSVKGGVVADDGAGCGPVPVSARLIITSPVSSRACFVENPHRRSVCKPLTLPLPRVDEVPSSDDTLPLLASSRAHPTSLRRRGDLEPSVVVGVSDDVDPTNYGRSWYDVVRDGAGGGSPRTVAAQPRGCVSGGLSLAGDYASSDARSVSSQSSVVSDKSSETSSGSLRCVAYGRRITETPALDDGREPKVAVRINAPSPVLSTRPRRTTSTMCAVAATDQVVSKSFAGISVDGVVTKGINLKRLKKSKRRANERPENDTDVDLRVDTERLCSRRADRPTFSGLASTDGPANDWRVSREHETDSRSVFTSFLSNSLGRHDSLQTGNKFADYCSATGNIVSSSQLSTGAT